MSTLPTLSPEQRETFLDGFALGENPADLCAKVGIPFRLLPQILAGCPDFQAEFNHALAARNLLVEHALFQSALNGKVSAQTYWLKTHPFNPKSQAQESTSPIAASTPPRPPQTPRDPHPFPADLPNPNLNPSSPAPAPLSATSLPNPFPPERKYSPQRKDKHQKSAPSPSNFHWGAPPAKITFPHVRPPFVNGPVRQ